MSSGYALFRLFGRPGVLADLVITTVFAIMLSNLGARLGIALFGGVDSGPGGDVGQAALSLHVCLLTGAIVGTVANFAVQDLLYCRFSWDLPGLGAALRKGLSWLAVVSVVLGGGLGALLALPGGGSSLLMGAALGLAGFGLGTLLWDPMIGRGPCFLAQALLIGAVIGGEHLESWIAANPWPALPVAAVLAVTSVHRSTSRSAARRRAQVGIQNLPASFRVPGAAVPWTVRFGIFEGRWGSGAILGRRGWTRALFYETTGWIPGSWKGQAILIVFPLTLALVLGSLFLGWHETGTLQGGLVAIARGLADPLQPVEGVEPQSGPNFVGHVATFAAVLSVLASQLDLRRGVSYPLSRADRAAIVWRASLQRGLGVLLLLGVALAVVGLIAAELVELEWRASRVPEPLVAILLNAAALPLLQWLRFRFVDCGILPAYSAVLGAALGAVGLVYMGTLGALLVALREARPGGAAVLALAVAPGVWVLTQLAFRHWLRRYFATADLA